MAKDDKGSTVFFIYIITVKDLGGSMEIILYSTHCPRCKVLEAKLNLKNIAYTECTDIDKMQSMGIISAPVLGVDGKLLQFKEATDWVNTHGGESVEN